MLFSSFCHQKRIKKKQTLHETIRASSLSITFIGFSFKPVYPAMVLKNFKFMENYNYWKMHLQVKILILDNFLLICCNSSYYPYRPWCHNPPPGSIITPGNDNLEY